MSAFQEMFAAEATQVEPDYERLAQLALASSAFGSIRKLRVAQVGDSMVLSGNVATFYQKQIAQELVRSASGPIAVVNEIQVP
jgi:hypothetical protein